MPDHVVASAEVVAHPDSIAENDHVARAVFVGPFAEKCVHVVVVLGILWKRWFDGGRVIADEGRGLYACGFAWLP